MSLNKKSVTVNAMWHSLAALFSTGVRFLTIPILVRILNPEDFGNVAIAMAILMFITMVFGNGGAVDSMVYFAKKRADMLSTLFWFNQALGITLAASVYLLSPTVVTWLNAPNALPYIQALCALFPILMLQSVFRGQLIAKLRFGYIAKINASASTVSTAIAVVLAYLGAGAWSLVIQHILMHSVLALAFYRASSEKPSMKISAATLKAFLPFYYKTAAYNTIIWLGSQAPLLFASKFAGATGAGVYNMMLRTSSLPREVFGQGFLMSFFSNLANSQAETQSKESQQQSLFWATKLNLWILGTIYAAAAVLAEPIVSLVLGAKFAPYWQMFQWLCVGMVFASATGGFIGFLKGTGQVGAMTILSIVRAALIMTLVFVFWRLDNQVLSIAVGYALANTLVTLIYFLVMIFYLKFNAKDLINNTFAPLMNLSLTSLGCFGLLQLFSLHYTAHPLLLITVGLAIFGSLFILFCLLISRHDTLKLSRTVQYQLAQKLGR
ncbi:oligosaccharide flippase family protein [Vibrio paucivorans]